MEKNINLIQKIAIISLLIVASLGIIFASITYYKSVANDYTSKTMSAEGEGLVNITPDVAQFNISVRTESKLNNLKEVQDENSKKNNDIISFLKSKGVEDKDIQTTNYSVNPKYNYTDCYNNKGGCNPKIDGYFISNQLTIKIRDFNIIGIVLGEVINLGANEISGPTFTLDNKDEAEDKARAEAILKAKARALKIAKDAGIRLGDIVSISDISNDPYYYAAKGGFDMDRRETGAPGIMPGATTVSVKVNITYEIK